MRSRVRRRCRYVCLFFSYGFNDFSSLCFWGEFDNVYVFSFEFGEGVFSLFM